MRTPGIDAVPDCVREPATSVAVDRPAVLTGAVLIVVGVAAWVGVVGYHPPMGVAGFLAGWTLMMTAMMLPSILPLVRLYRGARSRLAAGYLTVWSAIGLMPWLAMERHVQPAVPLVLALAGAYELSPLKTLCLRRCRSAATYLMQHYCSGPLRLGAEHGLWCVACCMGLMTVLVLAAAMSLAWAALLAATVFVQKVLPAGEMTARLTGVVLLVAAAGAATS